MRKKYEEKNNFCCIIKVTEDGVGSGVKSRSVSQRCGSAGIRIRSKISRIPKTGQNNIRRQTDPHCPGSRQHLNSRIRLLLRKFKKKALVLNFLHPFPYQLSQAQYITIWVLGYVRCRNKIGSEKLCCAKTDPYWYRFQTGQGSNRTDCGFTGPKFQMQDSEAPLTRGL